MALCALKNCVRVCSAGAVLHVELLLLVVHLLALHAPLQQRVVLLTQQIDLTQQVVVLLLQVAFQATQQLNTHKTHTQADLSLGLTSNSKKISHEPR